jgi:hypothetical protein
MYARSDPTDRRGGEIWDCSDCSGRESRVDGMRPKSVPNVLKSTRNRVSFGLNGVVFLRNCFTCEEFELCPHSGVFKCCRDKELRPILAGTPALDLRNPLPVFEMRFRPNRKKWGAYCKPPHADTKDAHPGGRVSVVGRGGTRRSRGVPRALRRGRAALPEGEAGAGLDWDLLEAPGDSRVALSARPVRPGA